MFEGIIIKTICQYLEVDIKPTAYLHQNNNV